MVTSRGKFRSLLGLEDGGICRKLHQLNTSVKGVPDRDPTYRESANPCKAHASSSSKGSYIMCMASAQHTDHG